MTEFLHVGYFFDFGDGGVVTHSCRNQPQPTFTCPGKALQQLKGRHCNSHSQLFFILSVKTFSCVVQSGVCDILWTPTCRCPPTHTYTHSCCILLLQFWRVFCTSEPCGRNQTHPAAALATDQVCCVPMTVQFRQEVQSGNNSASSQRQETGSSGCLRLTTSKPANQNEENLRNTC